MSIPSTGSAGCQNRLSWTLTPFLRASTTSATTALAVQLARALAVEDHVAQHIALDEDGIEDVIDTGQLVCLRHEAGLDTGGNAAVLAPLHPGDELDDAAQLLPQPHHPP